MCTLLWVHEMQVRLMWMGKSCGREGAGAPFRASLVLD